MLARLLSVVLELNKHCGDADDEAPKMHCRRKRRDKEIAKKETKQRAHRVQQG